MGVAVVSGVDVAVGVESPIEAKGVDVADGVIVPGRGGVIVAEGVDGTGVVVTSIDPGDIDGVSEAVGVTVRPDGAVPGVGVGVPTTGVATGARGGAVGVAVDRVTTRAMSGAGVGGCPGSAKGVGVGTMGLGVGTGSVLWQASASTIRTTNTDSRFFNPCTVFQLRRGSDGLRPPWLTITIMPLPGAASSSVTSASIEVYCLAGAEVNPVSAALRRLPEPASGEGPGVARLSV